MSDGSATLGGVRTSLAALTVLLILCACGRDGSDAFVAPRLAPGAPTRAWPPPGWAWGLIQLENRPSVRYGVSAPAGASVGDVIVLTGYGESAEWWFETARDLNGQGYTVWVLEAEGQGGSGRFTASRDLGHAKNFDGDIDTLQAFLAVIVRPAPDRPPQIIASGTAGLTALAAMERGLPAKRLILTSPRELEVTSGGLPAALALIGVNTLRASGGEPWARPVAGSAITARQKTALGWAVANPDLRIGGPSTGWLKERDRLRKATLAPEALRRISPPVSIFASDERSAAPCAQIPRCTAQVLAGRLPYPIENDQNRAAWMLALMKELGTDHAP